MNHMWCTWRVDHGVMCLWTCQSKARVLLVAIFDKALVMFIHLCQFLFPYIPCNFYDWQNLYEFLHYQSCLNQSIRLLTSMFILFQVSVVAEALFHYFVIAILQFGLTREGWNWQSVILSSNSSFQTVARTLHLSCPCL